MTHSYASSLKNAVFALLIIGFDALGCSPDSDDACTPRNRPSLEMGGTARASVSEANHNVNGRLASH